MTINSTGRGSKIYGASAPFVAVVVCCRRGGIKAGEANTLNKLNLT